MMRSCFNHISHLPRVSTLLLFAAVCFFNGLNAQEAEDKFPEEYDEFFVYLSVENLGYYQIDAVYAEDELYLPCLTLFKNLSIYTTASAGLDTISGYMADKAKTFQINLNANTSSYQDKTVALKPRDYLISFDDVFISSRVYKELFGFSMNLDFRSLMVRLQSDSELPIVKILKQQKLRENLKSLRGEVKIDTVIQRDFHVLKGGVLDWNLRFAQASDVAPSAQFRGSLGAEVLGGELVIRSGLSTQARPQLRNQSFRWRYVNDSSAFIRQVNAGFIGVPLNSQVTTPLLGVGVSNTPVGFRSSYGSMMLQRKTQPGWEVEVFVNNTLVGYTTADANGDVQIEIPLMYGSTEIQIRYYGPWGEEEIEEQSLVIPFVFVPQGKLEYQAFTGITTDSLNNVFSYARVAYGLNRRTTVFVGHEHFTRNTVNRTMPFASASFVLTDALLFNYQYVNNVYQTGALNWRSEKGFFWEGRAKLYREDQDAELNSNLREYTTSFNFPFSIGKTRWLTRGQMRHLELPRNIVQNAEGTISTFYKRFNGGMTVGGNLQNTKQIYAALNASLQLPKQWLLQAGAQYTMENQTINNVRMLVQKRFKRRVVVNLSANNLQDIRQASINLNVFFDLGWMGFSGEASYSQDDWSSTQNINGSTLMGRAPKRLQTNTRSTMGRGAIDAMVYLDINHNNQKDDDEPLVKGISVGMNRGVQTLLDNDSIFRFVALEPYTRHILTVSESGLQQISWRLPFTTIGVYADPNSVKKVFIPIMPMGEVAGMVMSVDSLGNAKPAARIPILITDANGVFVARVASDASGYYNYTELKPGVYLVSPDPEAMKRAGFTAPPAKAVTIRPMKEGDYTDGVDFEILNSEF
ncbi:MAG: carboxypeptidase-like regulatory domain-containing protein [Flavobacteriales bacterium]|jgi:hypothetical protein